ncbi:hypothetical protein ACI7YW_10360 [Clostridium ljungdahlii]|uniref:hypothetical protein n=1 Tax=Clostridium ljungdahlii TaxID=1538 RepID=UPI0038681BB8
MILEEVTVPMAMAVSFYNCPNYITEVKFYPILKQELELMEKEMIRYKELGQQRSWERQYVKYKYLKPLVD